MTNTIEIKLDDAALRARLNGLMSALANTQPMMASIASELAAQTELAFTDEGPGWPQLKPNTVKRRGSAHPILQVSNALARSVTAQSGADYAQVGSNLSYAAIHQFGGTIKRKGKAGSVRLRTDAKGNLLRQSGNSNLARFAKGTHKRYTERNYQGKDYSIEIPARPFLPITANGQLKPTALDAVMGVLQQFLTKP
jgi:phage virion morphogenesis protein